MSRRRDGFDFGSYRGSAAIVEGGLGPRGQFHG
ncbi:hypothetical protein MGAST_28635 [Mycobacterium gastri 'Wayne']|nr:hypothetical protein MGAST_28635 [Mycobacterium gastri 'Wayne']